MVEYLVIVQTSRSNDNGNGEPSWVSIIIVRKTAELMMRIPDQYVRGPSRNNYPMVRVTPLMGFNETSYYGVYTVELDSEEMCDLFIESVRVAVNIGHPDRPIYGASFLPRVDTLPHEEGNKPSPER